jgi:hypothetical protein
MKFFKPSTNNTTSTHSSTTETSMNSNDIIMKYYHLIDKWCEERNSIPQLHKLNPITRIFYSSKLKLKDLLIYSFKLNELFQETKKDFSSFFLLFHSPQILSISNRLHTFQQQYQINVKHLKIFNLICLHGKPQVYLQLSMKNSDTDHCTYQTSKCYDNLHPSWENEEYEFFITSIIDSYLEILVIYSGVIYGSMIIGKLKISLSSIDVSSIDNEIFLIDCSFLPKVKAMVEKNILHGIEPPKLSLTIELISL